MSARDHPGLFVGTGVFSTLIAHGTATSRAQICLVSPGNDVSNDHNADSAIIPSVFVQYPESFSKIV